MKILRISKIASIILLLIISKSFSQENDKTVSSEAFRLFNEAMLLESQNKNVEALRYYQEALKYDKSAIIYKLMADIYTFKTGKLDLAAPAYEKYLETNLTDDRTIDIVRRIYIQSKRYSKAVTFLSKMIAKGVDSPTLYFQIVETHILAKNTPEALTSSLNYMKRTSLSQDGAEKVAKTFIANKLTKEGLRYYSNYLKNSPADDNIGIIVGIFEEANQNFPSALNAYNTVLRKNEFASKARQRAAAIYINMNQTSNALKLYENINFDDPSEVNTKVAIAQKIISSQDPNYSNIKNILNPLKNKFGVNAQVFYFLGIAHYYSNEYEEASINLTESFRRNPANPQVAFVLAISYINLKDYEKASRAIDNAVNLQPNVKRFHNLRGSILNELGKYDEAIASYEKALIADLGEASEMSSIYNDYSYLLAVQGRELGKALTMARKATSADPNNTSFLDTLGWVYYKMKKYDDALLYINKAVDINNDSSAEVYAHLGDVHFELGNKNDAKKYWKIAFDKDNTLTEIKAKLDKNK